MVGKPDKVGYSGVAIGHRFDPCIAALTLFGKMPIFDVSTAI